MTTAEKINAFTQAYIPWWDRDDSHPVDTEAMLNSRKGRRDLYEFFHMVADDNIDQQDVFNASVDILLDIIELERRPS